MKKAKLGDTYSNRRSPSWVILRLVVGALARVFVHLETIVLTAIHSIIQIHGRWGYLSLLIHVMHWRITAVDVIRRDERWIGWCHLSCGSITLPRFCNWRSEAIRDRRKMAMTVFLAGVRISIR